MPARKKYVNLTPTLLRKAANFHLSARQDKHTMDCVGFMCLAVETAGGAGARLDIGNLLTEHGVSLTGNLNFTVVDRGRLVTRVSPRSNTKRQHIRFMFLHFLAEWLADEIKARRA